MQHVFKQLFWSVYVSYGAYCHLSYRKNSATVAISNSWYILVYISRLLWTFCKKLNIVTKWYLQNITVFWVLNQFSTSKATFLSWKRKSRVSSQLYEQYLCLQHSRVLESPSSFSLPPWLVWFWYLVCIKDRDPNIFSHTPFLPCRPPFSFFHFSFYWSHI